MAWDVTDIVEAVERGLRTRAAELETEQAVYGIDCLDELALHPLIQQSLRAADYGVWPEQRYPCDRLPRRRKSEGKRCDVVLTPDDRPLQEPDAEATLFATEDAVVLEAAYWLEIKTVAQFTVDGPFARYSAELLQPVSHDIRKLAGDRLVFHAGLMLVLFTTDQRTADHDLAVWLTRCEQRGYPVADPIVRGFPITDRIGNGWTATALFPVRRL
jgi:hypothetical protein